MFTSKKKHNHKITARHETAGIVISRYGTIIGLLLLISLFIVLKPGIFPRFKNVVNILNQISLLGIISAGLTVCMIMNDFDVSIAAIATLCGVLVVALLPHMNMWLAISIILLLGLAIGFANGIVITILGVSSFIATLAMMSILKGITIWYTGGYSLYSGIPRSFVNLARGTLLSIPYLVFYMLFIVLFCYFILGYSQWGKKFYAVGGNPEAARFSSISITRTRIAGFLISGFLSSLTGILMASRLSSGQPRAGEGLLLNAFAAVFLGAVTIRNGQFHAGGTLIGVLIMGVTFNGLTILGIPFFLQYVIQGAILILAVAASGSYKRSY